MKAAERHDIPIGRMNAILRRDLAALWDTDERSVRGIIARMRKQQGDGLAILSSSTSPAGYWRSADIGEIRAFIAETTARARNTLAALEDARRVLNEAESRRDYPDSVLWR